MPPTYSELLRWTARVAGVLVCLFLGMFALDAFSPGQTFLEALPDFLIHLTPAVVLLGIVILSWRREWIAGATFFILAGLYALSVPDRLEWILVISGPLAAVGALFFWSWIHRRSARTPRDGMSGTPPLHAGQP